MGTSQSKNDKEKPSQKTYLMLLTILHQIIF